MEYCTCLKNEAHSKLFTEVVEFKLQTAQHEFQFPQIKELKQSAFLD